MISLSVFDNDYAPTPYLWAADDEGLGGTLSGTHYSQAQIAAMLALAGWPADLIPTMAAVVMAESSGYVGALNSTAREYSVGLAQINLRAHTDITEAQARDPLTNLRYALRLYRQAGGFSPWGAYTNGSYRRYLGANLGDYTTGAAQSVLDSLATSVPAIGEAEMLILALLGLVILFIE